MATVLYCLLGTVNFIMAGIDKTYTDSFEEYKEFKAWADNQVLMFFDGHKECIGDWVWYYEKEDFLKLLENIDKPITIIGPKYHKLTSISSEYQDMQT